MTDLVEILLVIGAAILAAVVIVGFFAVRHHIQRCMMNKYEDQ